MPTKCNIVQILKPEVKPRRFLFAKDILSNVEADENYPRREIISDAATFHASGRVNPHNCRIWASQSCYAIREIERHYAMANVWCAL
jgi:hypothetical protein